MTAGIHLKVRHDPVDIEAREGEDLRNLATLAELLLKEENFTLSSANVTIASDDIPLLIDHEASLVHVYVVALLIFAEQELNLTRAVPVKDTHDFLDLESLPVVVKHLGHETAKLLELHVVKTLDTVLVHDAALLVNHESLHRHEPTQLVNETITSLPFIEAQRVLWVFIEERAEQVERIEVVFFEGKWHRDVSTLVQLSPCEDFSKRGVMEDVTSLLVDQVAVVVDRSSLLIESSLVPVLVSRDYNVTPVVTIQGADNVNLVELTSVSLDRLHDRIINARLSCSL